MPPRRSPRPPRPTPPRGMQHAKLVAESQDLKLQCRSSAEDRQCGRKQCRYHGGRRELTENAQLPLYQADLNLREPQENQFRDGSFTRITRSAATSLSSCTIPVGHRISIRLADAAGPSPKCVGAALDDAYPAANETWLY